MEKQKLGETLIKGSEIKRIIERGPDAMLSDIKSYVDDCETLFERMQDLYKENIPVQLLGLRVHLIVDSADTTFFDAVFGCTEPVATEEEAEQKFKEMEL